MPTITVATNSYITLANANTYMTATLQAAAWSALADATKEAALITAARMIDRQSWQGERATSGQAMAWPRSGLTDREGNELSSSTVPQSVIDAQCELALLLSQDASIQSSTSSSQNIKRVQAGSASVEYFRAVAGGRFPTVVQELIGLWLGANSTGLITSMSSGTDVESFFEDRDLSLSGALT